jgi:hypothetical protein
MEISKITREKYHTIDINVLIIPVQDTTNIWCNICLKLIGLLKLLNLTHDNSIHHFSEYNLVFVNWFDFGYSKIHIS